MDQNSLVIEELEAGRILVDGLRMEGLEVEPSFWARLSDENTWFLYLATPLVDTDGAAATYRRVHNAIRRLPALGLDPFEMKVISPADAMAKAAIAAIQPKPATGPFAVPNPKPYTGITRFRGTSLGG